MYSSKVRYCGARYNKLPTRSYKIYRLVIGSYSMVLSRFGGIVSNKPWRRRKGFDCGSVTGKIMIAESFFVAAGACCAKALPIPQKAEISKKITVLGAKNLIKCQRKNLYVIINFLMQTLLIVQLLNHRYSYSFPAPAPFRRPALQNPASPGP